MNFVMKCHLLRISSFGIANNDTILGGVEYFLYYVELNSRN